MQSVEQQEVQQDVYALFHTVLNVYNEVSCVSLGLFDQGILGIKRIAINIIVVVVHVHKDRL